MSDLTRYAVRPERVQEVLDLRYDPGFSTLKRIIDEHVAMLTEKLTRSPAMAPEEMASIVLKIQTYRSVSELPEIIYEKTCREG